VATAVDPMDAFNKINLYKPDVITCDIEMPIMNGIEFVQRLIPQYPIPVIMVSSINGAVFDAMNAGAIDFIVKPDLRSVSSVEHFIQEMVTKIKSGSRANILKIKAHNSNKVINTNEKSDNKHIIAIGASTGGTDATYQILKNLPGNMPGIVVVQHIPPDFSRMYAERLKASTPFDVREAKTGDYVESGRVFIAPGDQHMIINKIGGRYRIECYHGDKVNGHCPSVDVLFESVAKEAGPNSIGIILTGMGYDGAKGLLSMRQKGAKTIGQDESTSVVYGMPKVAYNIGAVEKQLSLQNIGSMICTMRN
jgi:two-component system chemotaxis response regulator CheB